MGSSRSWECIVLLFSVAVEFSPLSLPTSLLRLGPNFRERRGVEGWGGMIARDPTNLRLVVSAAGQRPSLLPAPKRTRCLFVPASVGVTTHPPRGGAANCHYATAYIYIYIICRLHAIVSASFRAKFLIHLLPPSTIEIKSGHLKFFFEQVDYLIGRSSMEKSFAYSCRIV